MRTALVTGASSGLGEIFAHKLAARGCDLILVARRHDRLEKLGAELGREHNVLADSLPADLTRDDDLARVERRIETETGLEYLINNAGFGTVGMFYKAPADEQDRMHRLHVIATMRLTRAALPGMMERNRGAIVNVSSTAAFFQSPGNVSYCATKCWMNSFTEGLWMELRRARSGVRVQALCPGFTYTEFHDAAGMDRSLIPKTWWMQADRVINESLAALDRGKLFVIPGWRYKAAVAVSGIIPVGLLRALQAKADPRHRKRR